jgi:Phospholipid methyltransferase
VTSAAGGEAARVGTAARLARWRVPLGFLSAPVVFWLAQPTSLTLAIGVAIAATGEALRVWAAGHLNKAREVTVSGPYRWMAHPLYVGSAVMGLGVSVACGSALVFVIVAVYFAVTLTAAIASEEASLRRTFGDRYDRYRRGGSEATAKRFSLRQVRANREHRAVAGLVFAILLLCVKAAYNGVFWRVPAGR